MKALIIVDIQNDFLPSGSLAVENGDVVIPVINRIQEKYDLIIATQDWHPKDHKSFASQHGNKRVFEQIKLSGLDQILWPDHCVQGTFGADFSEKLDQNKIEAIFRKGMNPDIDSYSGFFDNGKLKSTGLGDYLKGRGVSEVDVCGLAADFCVYFTAKDALELGFKVKIIENATQPIDKENFQKLKSEFIKSGGEISVLEFSY